MEEDKSTKHPWKFIYQNIRSLISENSRMKIDYFNEYVDENKVILMNFTETWLNNGITEEAKINGYNEFRGDRIETKQGGTAIYLHNKIEGVLLIFFSKNKCEMVAIKVAALNLINIVCYRPPHTKMTDFKYMIDEIKNIFKDLERPDPTILWTGDFNFPFVQWKECSSGGCKWDFNPNINASLDEKEQFRTIMNLCSDYNLIQTIDEPTRGVNTIDLIFTNELDLFSSSQISFSALSDHYFIEMTTTLKTDDITKDESSKEVKEGLRSLILFSNKVNWKEIIKEIDNINWQELLENKNTNESTKILNNIINKICIRYVPVKEKNSGKKKIPRERKKLLGRLKMLRQRLRKAINKEKKEEINESIKETDELLIEARRNERLEKELAIIENIPRNTKLLFSYTKKEINRRKEIGPFEKDGEYIHNGSDICNMLVNEYKTQFTKTVSNLNQNLSEEIKNINEEDLTDIIFTEDDMIKAIEKLNENSGPGPDGIPAIFLIKTSSALIRPLMIILRKSMDEGEIPAIYKVAHITPINKVGKKSKLNPENYRPVSLTSHIMKIYERIIIKNIINHLLKKQ